MTEHARPRRFFASDLSAEQVCLTGDEAHHATNVLRLGAGSEVELFDGRGGAARGRIVEAKRGCVAVRVETAQPALVENNQLHTESVKLKQAPI